MERIAKAYFLSFLQLSTSSKMVGGRRDSILSRGLTKRRFREAHPRTGPCLAISIARSAHSLGDATGSDFLTNIRTGYVFGTIHIAAIRRVASLSKLSEIQTTQFFRWKLFGHDWCNICRMTENAEIGNSKNGRGIQSSLSIKESLVIHNQSLGFHKLFSSKDTIY